jgi:hypothetical protein
VLLKEWKAVTSLNSYLGVSVVICQFLFSTHFVSESGEKFLFKANHLNTLELLEELNKIVLPLVPPPTQESKIVETKATKKRRK